MSAPKRIVVMESSALLTTLQNFTDAHNPSLAVLDRLLQPGEDGAPLVDEIRIPDHVFYELTGILPISFPRMRTRLATAATQGKTKLDEIVEMYAQTSPRGDKNDPEGKIKNHVRALLHFVARHPEALVSTETSKRFCERLKADYGVLCAAGEDQRAHYRPSFADAFHYLGDDFKASDLRVHIGQLMMMGLMTEKEYNDRMGEEEKEGGRKKRFLLMGEMLDRLSSKRATANDDSIEPESIEAKGHERRFITQHAREAISEAEDVLHKQAKKGRAEHGDKKNYLTLGFFERYPAILEASEDDYRRKERNPVKRSKIEHSRPNAGRLREAVGPSPLLIEHYCYGGILPKSNPALLAIAQALAIDIAGLDMHMPKHDLRRALHERGFFEISPTLSQLKTIEADLNAQNIDHEMLQHFIGKVSHHPRALREQFVQACKAERDDKTAVPYEKVFTHALINGSLAWAEFFALLKQSHAVFEEAGAHQYTNPQHDFYINAEGTQVRLASSGVMLRGHTHPGSHMEAPIDSHTVAGKNHSYYQVAPEALVQRGWHELTQPSRYPKQVAYVFESMLAPAVQRDAAHLREQAQQLLGEDRLVQMEKDYANRHARKHLQSSPPYRNIFAALHTNSRIARKNLGEIAVLEAAEQANREAPGANVWIINHDSDLFPNQARRPQLEASLIRQHAGLVPGLASRNQAAATNPQLHFVNTRQFMETLSRMLRRDVDHSGQPTQIPSATSRGLAFGILDRPIVRGISPSWQAAIDAPLGGHSK